VDTKNSFSFLGFYLICFGYSLDFYLQYVRIASSRARIKPTAPLSVFDKENLTEFLLDLLYYIYNYYCGYAPYLP